MIESKRYSQQVLTWLFVGIVMVFLQVVIGGITRLTESGLSITKWDVMSGTFPPMTESGWQNEFDLYKQTPQYREINEGMSFSDFKFIYFWEYIHRLWARIMGFVFLIPFIYFVIRKKLDRKLYKNLSIVMLLAILAATFGWIMVASGLIERPWVNAYKLSLHLLIAFSVYVALLWTYIESKWDKPLIHFNNNGIYTLFYWFTGFFILQLFLGGVLSGMRAAVVYPTWPDMNGTYFPSIVFDLSQWNSDNFNNYDKNPFMPALIHFLHRNTAYLVMITGLILSYKFIKNKFDNTYHYFYKKVGLTFAVLILLQVLLGVLTVINSKGEIPVSLGVFHQMGALLLISIIVYIYFLLKRTTTK